MPPQLIFGTATFGMDSTDFQDSQSLYTLYKTLQELDIRRLDSGARYPPLKPGRAEELIGVTKEIGHGFIIDTKVYTDVRTDGGGDLKSEAIDSSIQASLQRLKLVEGVSRQGRLKSFVALRVKRNFSSITNVASASR